MTGEHDERSPPTDQPEPPRPEPSKERGIAWTILKSLLIFTGVVAALLFFAIGICFAAYS